MEISVEKVKPIRLGKDNIIILRRTDIVDKFHEISNKIAQQVKKPIFNDVKPNVIYGLRFLDKQIWRRALLKFTRPDGVNVMDFVDYAGVCEFDTKSMEMCEISDSDIVNLPAGEFKFIIFAVKKYTFDDEFQLIFNALCRETVTGIFCMIEQKQNKINECFAGDLVYNYNGTVKSFRETLIEQQITYPSGVRNEFNKKIFLKRFDHGNLFTPPSATYEPNPIDGFSEFSNEYKTGDILGEGSFGLVFEGYDTVNDKRVAIKIFKKEAFKHEEQGQKIMEEANMVMKCSSENVVQLYNTEKIHGITCMVFELCSKSLDEELYSESYKFNKYRTKQVMRWIFSGLNHIHSIGITHRDIKPGNILLDSLGVVKISDFGLATESETIFGRCGTARYMAPEIYLDNGYSTKVDIWAAACVFAELCLQRDFIEVPGEKGIHNIFKVMGKPTKQQWPYPWEQFEEYDAVNWRSWFRRDLVVFIEYLAVMNPVDRPTAIQALNRFS